MSTSVLPERLAAAVTAIRIDLSRFHAVIGDRIAEATSRGELEPLLTQALYAELHAGIGNGRASNATLRRDRGLENALAAAIPHASTTATAVLRQITEHQALVEWDGVLVWLPSSTVDSPDLPAPGNPVQLRVPPARPGLSPGFLLVSSSRAVEFSRPPLRIYVHLTDPLAAVDAWQAVLVRLEGADVAYQAKILVRPSQYPRRDALVVYLPPESVTASDIVTNAVEDLPGTGTTTSTFAERLAPGVARAWEPVDERFGFSGLSFGLHRSKVLAKALLDSAAAGTPPETHITTEFLAAGIDPANPALNHERNTEP
ncbi:T3SS effector HopA1 family protein [Amycolatopsis azurea]|uniref:T3SS effector HopA1 family protein n=1 Tax=Amycolatopsis azurea TaxID=36819 RepID=UPI00380A99AF